jgi:siroheme synthase
VVAGTVGTLPAIAKAERVKPPALIVVGEVVALRESLDRQLEFWPLPRAAA